MVRRAIIILLLGHLESPVLYGVSVGDSRKPMVVHGWWIERCGLSVLRVGALNIPGMLYLVCSRASSVSYS